MSRNFRRFYSAFAILIFCISAPIVIIWTSGWRWTGWHSGFSATGAVYITSSPRATVLLNGQPQGQTPQHITHLLPGVYTVELQRSGYSVWRHTIRVAGKVAQVIGPVQLFPASFSVNDLPLSEAQTVLATSDHQSIFRILVHDTTWQVAEVWPTSGALLTLQHQPTAVSGSNNQQNLAFWQSGQATIITKQPSDPWIVDVDDVPVWDTSSSSVCYGLSAGHVVRFDTLQRTTTVLGEATSFVLDGDVVWATISTATTTNVTRQQTFGQDTATTVLQRDGSWLFLPLAGAVAIHNTVDQTTITLQYDAITHRATTTTLGAADSVWWPDTHQPPLWISGADLSTINQKGVPQLIDRFAAPTLFAQWIDPQNILLTIDDHTVHIQSVSDQQGRSTLLERTFDEHIQILGIDLNQQQLLIRLIGQPDRVVVVSWRVS